MGRLACELGRVLVVSLSRQVRVGSIRAIILGGLVDAQREQLVVVNEVFYGLYVGKVLDDLTGDGALSLPRIVIIFCFLAIEAAYGPGPAEQDSVSMEVKVGANENQESIFNTPTTNELASVALLLNREEKVVAIFVKIVSKILEERAKGVQNRGKCDADVERCWERCCRRAGDDHGCSREGKKSCNLYKIRLS